MSYCGSCDILRPPRSFHCSTCGCCVEVHDHHCPWVGTCVGRRNIRYFIGFIFWTSIHAFIVFSMSAYSCFSYGLLSEEINDTLYGTVTKAIMVYTGIIGSVLFLFSMFQLFELGINNKASNEDIRSRWNGSACNTKNVEIFKDDCSIFDKVKFIFWSDIPESRLDTYI